MKKILSWAFVVLLTMPCVLHAEDVVIQLIEVVEMETLPGDNPLDDPDAEGNTPTRPTDFRAVINGNTLSVEKQKESIPSAKVSVVNASNGGLVLNQTMTDSMEETVSNNGVYVLRIETTGGALVGQFVVK